jgi:transcriptional regulator with XRE-family HTH domain
LTQAQLGKRLGVSQAVVSQWETGKTIPSEDTLEQLKSLLGGNPPQSPGLDDGATAPEPAAPGQAKKTKGSRKKKRERSSRNSTGANVHYEAELWRMADALRGCSASSRNVR